VAAFGWLGPLRAPLRRHSLAFLRQLLDTDEGRRSIHHALEGHADASVTGCEAATYGGDHVYSDLGRASAAGTARRAPVFITARFRTGSTLLWNLFRHVEGCVSYYEPLNERRFFDPTTRGDRIDGTHLGVSDYWREYEGLDRLGRFYDERWTRRNLYMNGRFHAPALHAYIETMIQAAPGRAVLQFNRVDFRLAWLRQHFPDATLIHLYRHPRDQWCSSLVNPSSVPRDITVRDFPPHDAFYLLSWAEDLSYVFPFLKLDEAEHPYDLFYLIWKLSYAFGRAYCEASFSLERLMADPGGEVARLMSVARVEGADLPRLVSLVTPQPTGKWRVYADADWFAAREARCEEILANYFRPARRPV
jgi:hypothetical protein